MCDFHVKPIGVIFSKHLSYLIIITSFLTACGTNKTPDVVITDINIIDIEKGSVIEHQDVQIIGNKIYKIKNHQPTDSKLTETINGNGKFLIPGLWDMHAHIRSYSHEDVLPLFIMHGVTGIRDLGLTNFELIKKWKDKIKKGEILGPKIRTSGFIIEGSAPSFRSSVVLTDVKRVKPVIDSLMVKGVDLIKLYDTLDKEVYEAIIHYCKENDLLTVGHIPPSLNQNSASELGITSIEHLSGLDNTLHKYYSQEDFDKYISILQKKGTYQCPTLINYSLLARLDTSKKEKNLILGQIDNDYKFDLAPKYYKAWWSRIKENYEKSKKYKGKANKLAFYKGIVKKLNENGVKILAGTDTPNPYLLPGLSLHEELILLAEAGLSNTDVLKTATLYPAQFFNETNYTGTVSENSIADLVILDANPLENISNTQKINAVIFNGKPYSNTSLNSIRSSHLDRMNEYNTTDFDQYIYMKLQKEGVSTIINNYIIPENNNDYTIEKNHLVRLSETFVEAGEINDAIKLLNWNIKIFPNYKTTYHRLGELYLNRLDTTNAINNFEKIKAIDPLDSINSILLKKINSSK